jgi:hydrogenase maturation protein HypF
VGGLAVRTDASGLAPAVQARRILIRGIVQGVGFRPFVYRLALAHGIQGWVRNTSWGVEMEVEAPSADLARFVAGLRDELPPLARIESLESVEIAPEERRGFEIRHSEAQAGAYQLVSPDIATCPDCLRELLDPADRRYRYPFTNCTNCGPRFTIIESLPYDRPRTTMRAFPMCSDCQGEYDDPLDRRFHAQPNACPVCGPHLALRDGEGRALAERDEALRGAAARLLAGEIVALKGLGGYQLACDATDEAAVARLRARKHRPDKPLAVMVAGLAAAEALVALSGEERELLAGSAAPIVLALRRDLAGGGALAPGVAPDNRYLGVMLPYTPLHHLLLRDVGRPLVMTSGNLSEEPIARDNDEALRRLRGIADCFLTHNRDIHSRYDDSVWFVPAGGPQPVRRARGYAPAPIRLPFEAKPILACGAELKNTFCLTRDRYAFLSQHVGDLENAETLEHFESTVALYRELFDVAPEIVAHDLHPDYLATRYALAQPGERVAVQHHHAHLAACLADNGLDEPAIGVIMDGTGYGEDGRIWGGEFLVGDGRAVARRAHLQYLPLPGGDAGARRPYRLALAALQALDLPLPATLADVPAAERDNLAAMVARGIQTPLTSSAGRLFDTVAALLGLSREVSFEAQAAIALEMAAGDVRPEDVAPYGYALARDADPWRVELRPLFADLLADLAMGVPLPQMAYRFHATVAALSGDVCLALRADTGLNRVALSGGCFQNRLLAALTRRRLEAAGFEVLCHHQVPCNDGGLALGQAVIAHYTVGARHAVAAHHAVVGD